MRNLVSVQEIKALSPIEGADRIEVATILGWKLVVKKGEFKVGDKCAYFEVDSFYLSKTDMNFYVALLSKNMKSLEKASESEHRNSVVRFLRV